MQAIEDLKRSWPTMGALLRVHHEGRDVWALDEDGEAIGLGADAGIRLGPSASLTLLPPATPTKILGLGYNYRDLMKEQKQQAPLIFLKSPNALVLEETDIRIGPREQTWIEVELGIVIGEGGRDIPSHQAARHILGYVVANDVTAADDLGRDHHLANSKSRDGFCPVSRRLWRGVDASDLAVASRINGRLAQSSRTSDRFLCDAEAVSYASKHMTLCAGDLILTGTPAGARQAIVRPGDVAEVSIERIGAVRNRFTAASA